MVAMDIVADDMRRLWQGACTTPTAVYLAVWSFFVLLLASMAMIETAALAVTIPARAGALAFMAPCCWMIFAGRGIHRSKAWTREWESRRGWWRKRDDDRDEPPDDLPPRPRRQPPLNGAGGCVRAREKEMAEV